MNDMIGYCGLDCEECDAYIATINDDENLRKRTARLWAELNNAPILPEHINCKDAADGIIEMAHSSWPGPFRTWHNSDEAALCPETPQCCSAVC